MDAFATLDDLNRKYELTTAQASVAGEYLEDASCVITDLLARKGKTPEDVPPETLRKITRDAAYRALKAIGDGQPVTGYTQGAIGYSESFTFATPAPDIYLTKVEKQELGIAGGALYSVYPEIRGRRW